MAIKSWLVTGALALVGLGSACSGDEATPKDTGGATDATVDSTEVGPLDGTNVDDTDVVEEVDDKATILAVPESERWAIPGLEHPVQVVRTEGNVPHVYAQSELDMARVLGFVQARDRFFFMDVQRRLGEGRLSELLGDLAIANDVESRDTALPYLTDRLVEHASDGFKAYLGAFVAGVNHYIDEVRAGNAVAPSETSYAGLLGFATPADMMEPFTVRDMMALVAVVMSSTNFGTEDVGQTAQALKLDGLFDGVLDGELRQAGMTEDIFYDVRPQYPGTNSADGFGLTGAGSSGIGQSGGALTSGSHKTRAGKPAKAPIAMLDNLYAKLRARELQLGKDREAGFGSNAWAVMGKETKDGKTLFANDGHLELTIPPLAYGAHIDTKLFGGGDIALHGGWLGNFPVHIGGTNGDVAFGGVNPVLDITDWYSEELQLDADGKPMASKFDGAWKPLVEVSEQYVIANVATLGSVGRTETFSRFTTFDGRWITSIEGTTYAKASDAPAGSVVLDLMGDFVVPGDTDHDGKITAISFDYVALDATRWPEALRALGFAHNVDELREATRGYVGAALYTAGADRFGNVLYTSYQAIPCRGYLDVHGGDVTVGSDPSMLLDGTRFGGFTIPSGADGKVDEVPGQTDPYQCVVPFARMPYSIDPARGFVFTANNDPGGLTDDGDHMNDEYYLGGPWDSVRANSIRRALTALTEGDKHDADVEAMAKVQADKTSRMGETFVPSLIQAIAHGKTLSETDGTVTAWDQRIEALYVQNKAAFDEVSERLQAWLDAGPWAASGVETFYEHPSAQDLEDSVATMIFNAYISRFLQQVWGDEPGAYRYSGTREQVAGLTKFLAGRGADNPGQLASWNPDTGEAVFFDKLGTPEVERSDELMLMALRDGLAFLAGPGAPGSGGFDTADMSKWLWGLKHQAKFESVLLTFAGSIDAVQTLFADYSITTQRVPLADNIPAGDPRKGLTWFPRGGDQWGIDAANPGFGGTDFKYGSGPAMRLVYALDQDHPENVTGKFILPGGESGVLDSPHYDDQIRLWLANQAYPIRFAPKDVAAGATGRELYEPAP